MTNIITRFFDDAEKAQAVRFELVQRRRFPASIVSVFHQSEGLEDALTANDVAAATAEAYAKQIAKGGAVVLVRAGFKPLGVARISREVLRDMGAVETAGVLEEVNIKDPPPVRSSILKDHRHFMTSERDPQSTTYHMANWPIPLISRRVPWNLTAFPRHARMANFPIPLIFNRKPFSGSIFSRHARMANFPIPLLSNRKPYTGSAFAPHARMANFPIPLISRRKPYSGSIIPRHGRMATVPFPLLINEKTGGNALMPGGPRMANFPISLISQRKPYTGSAFSRHARMANFPIPLISRRKPYTGSIISKHGRMADTILPLTVRRDGSDPSLSHGYSLSKFFKLPTIIRR